MTHNDSLDAKLEESLQAIRHTAQSLESPDETLYLLMAWNRNSPRIHINVVFINDATPSSKKEWPEIAKDISEKLMDASANFMSSAWEIENESRKTT